MPHDDGVQHRVLFKGKLVLAQLAEAVVRAEHHLPAAGRKLTAEDLHEGGFAAAIGADQAIAVAVAEFHGDVFKQRLGTELHGDVGGRDQGTVL